MLRQRIIITAAVIGELFGCVCLGLWVYCEPVLPPKNVNLAYPLPPCPKWFRKAALTTENQDFVYSFYDPNEKSENIKRQKILDFVKMQIIRVKIAYILAYCEACLDYLFPVLIISPILAVAVAEAVTAISKINQDKKSDSIQIES